MEHNATKTIESADSGYLLSNSASEAPARFAALSNLYDAGTIRHLENLGLREGWHCLEVGGGGGSIATWLANRVGPSGHVLVTDIDPRFLEFKTHPNLEVRQHDIANDTLPEGTFDLVHARLVLMHVGEREKALHRMVTALKPGGWIIDEEFDSPADPSLGSGEVLLKTQDAFARHLVSGGVERRFGRRLFGLLQSHGLVEVAAEANLSMWKSGSAGVSFMRAAYVQCRVAMISAG